MFPLWSGLPSSAISTSCSHWMVRMTIESLCVIHTCYVVTSISSNINFVARHLFFVLVNGNESDDQIFPTEMWCSTRQDERYIFIYVVDDERGNICKEVQVWGTSPITWSHISHLNTRRFSSFKSRNLYWLAS